MQSELERVAVAAARREARSAALSDATRSELAAMVLVVATPRKANSCSGSGAAEA